MAGETTRPDRSTRYVETTRGILSYSELAPVLAEQVLRVERVIGLGDLAGRALSPELLLNLHLEVAGNLVPEWAGRWRTVMVQVGSHQAPPAHDVPILMKDFCEDLVIRLNYLSERVDDRLLESLAFAEGRFLSIHPFLDFNGRIARLFLREVLRRLKLPPVDLVPSGPREEHYIQALRAADQRNWEPLATIWRVRFEEFRPLI